MSDRLPFPVPFPAVCRGYFRKEFQGQPSEDSDGRPVWVVVIESEVKSPFRPIPERADVDVLVAGDEPRVKPGQNVQLHGMSVRAAVRKTGAPYLAVSADRVTVGSEQ